MFPQTKTMIMNPLHLQNLGSWEGLDMVEHYAQLEHIDLLREHKAHPPWAARAMEVKAGIG